MWLNTEIFKTVVASTPLVSIDLVVQNPQGEILLGQRLNRPAQNFWFVPGGRILKNETLDDAFRRITLMELGKAFDRKEARQLGVYEHFYTDSVFGETELSPDTHYVVLGYTLTLPDNDLLNPPDSQHDHYRWWTTCDMKSNTAVQTNTRAYLDDLR